MIVPLHASKHRSGHVTTHAATAFARGLMVRVGGRILDMLFVTRHARLIRVVRMTITAAGRVAVHAVEITLSHARTDAPKRVCEVLTEIAPVRIEITIFKCRQVVVIEKAIAGFK